MVIKWNKKFFFLLGRWIGGIEHSRATINNCDRVAEVGSLPAGQMQVAGNNGKNAF